MSKATIISGTMQAFSGRNALLYKPAPGTHFRSPDFAFYRFHSQGDQKCMSPRIATELSCALNLSSPGLSTTVGHGCGSTKAHQAATHTHTTPKMWHQAHLTPSTSWPNPTCGPPVATPILPLAGEEGTGDSCVLQQLIHPGQDAGVVDGEAHPRVHDEFNELLNIMVGLLVPNKEDPRQGWGVGADPSLSLHGWWVACICRRVGQEGG